MGHFNESFTPGKSFYFLFAISNKCIKTITNKVYQFCYRFITNPFAKLGNRLRPNEVTKYVQMR